MGAIYTGVGLVTVASSETVIGTIATKIPEAISLKATSTGEYLSLLKKVSACLIGCGLTQDTIAHKLMGITLGEARCPLVIDADGLNILSLNPSLKPRYTVPTIVTPHLGEFSRLTKRSISEIASNKEEIAIEYAKENNYIVVLKSDRTIVVTPSGLVYHNTIGNSGLAKAGSGDLLAGIIAGLVAMGYEAVDSAVTGVYIHSKAADIAATKRNQHSLTASYIAEYISSAYDAIFSG
jgi:NAD(P)H-hydrate epimerase